MSLSSAPLSSGAFFTPSLFAFNSASKALSDSTLKLSSGNRLSKAGDDVAAFSIATRMQSQLVTLKQASSNAAQGDSLLQVAQGGLEQIIDILDTMDALAAQSNSSSITSAERTHLQASFAAYIEEIDRISSTTSFNDINLLDGDLSGESEPTTTTTAATKASAILAFTANPTAGQTVVLNGVTFTEGVDFSAGGTTAITVEALKDALNSSTNVAISKATYTRVGDSLVITADSGGTLGEKFIVNQASSTTSFTTTGASTQTANIYTLDSGVDDGLGVGSTIATGTIGDTLVNTQSQDKGSVTLTLSGNAIANETLNIDDGNGSLLTFTFKASSSSSTEITIGATVEETLQNVVQMISQYSGTSNYVTSQLDFTINGSNLIIKNKVAGNVADFSGAVPDITETLTSGSLSASTITGGSNTGINVNGVNNAEFIGSITGFSATYVGADSLTASITVGSSTYTAAITDTTPAGNSTIRFSSTSGGYFDVQLAAGQGSTVSNQSTADTYATRLNAAIQGLTFYQNRPVSNFEATGSFVGASSSLQLSDFSEVRIDSIAVTAPASTDATIDVTINGTIFRASSGIGGTLGAYETLRFTSLENSNDVLTLTNGATAQDFSDTTAAAAFEEDLRAAFGLDETGAGVTFQVGVSTSDTVNVVVNNSSTDRLFNGETPDISTQDNAADAQDLIDTARNSVLSNLANVGALQARFQSAQDLNQKISEGVTTARSQLADTDIAEESTNYALAALRVSSGVAIIAQTRNLQSGLLSLVQAGLN